MSDAWLNGFFKTLLNHLTMCYIEREIFKGIEIENITKAF
jgi:hypothetical protein